MKNKANILLIPADNRPVSYLLPLQAAAINKGINIFIPPRELLGGLNHPADITEILCWLEKTLRKQNIDYIICALDTIAYGGLIPSRRCTDYNDQIMEKLNKFKEIIQCFKVKMLAFSSVLRISDSNINEEEKPYWDKWGKSIFQYSYLKHKTGNGPQTDIPPDILKDYLETRGRNFEINKLYLEWQNKGVFDYLLYTKDDTGKHGLNIQEAEYLSQYADIHTGYDEVITALTARCINTEGLSILPVYSTPNGKNIIARYEDKPLSETIEGHIKLANAQLASSTEEADLVLLAHTPQKIQNDLALDEFPEPDNQQSVDFCINYIKNSKKPVVLADVKNANGADDLLAKGIISLCHSELDSESHEIPGQARNDSYLYGYAGWNTASNTIGSALAMGIIRYTAQKQNCFCAESFKKLLFIRLMDDFVYQSIIRRIVRGIKITPDQVNLTFPWNRSFETEINL